MFRLLSLKLRCHVKLCSISEISKKTKPLSIFMDFISGEKVSFINQVSLATDDEPSLKINELSQLRDQLFISEVQSPDMINMDTSTFRRKKAPCPPTNCDVEANPAYDAITIDSELLQQKLAQSILQSTEEPRTFQSMNTLSEILGMPQSPNAVNTELEPPVEQISAISEKIDVHSTSFSNQTSRRGTMTSNILKPKSRNSSGSISLFSEISGRLRSNSNLTNNARPKSDIPDSESSDKSNSYIRTRLSHGKDTLPRVDLQNADQISVIKPGMEEPNKIVRLRSSSNAPRPNIDSAILEHRPRSDSIAKGRVRSKTESKQTLQQMDTITRTNSLAQLNVPSAEDLLGPSIKNIKTIFDEVPKLSFSKTPLDEYGTRNFNANEIGFCFQKIPIKKTMHKIADTSARKDALLAFESILIYCGDAPGDRFDAARSVVGFSKNNLISDEIICQMLKQTINNTSAVVESSIRAWALLCLVLVYVEPSLALKQALMGHLQIISEYEKPISRFAIKCMENLQLSSSESDKRKMLPSNIEIVAFETGRYCIPLKLDFPNGVSKSYNITPFTKGSDLLDRAIKYLSLADYIDHTIAIFVDGLEVLALLPEDKALDLVAIVEKMILDKEKNKEIESSLELLSYASFSVIRKVWLIVNPLLFNEMDEWELTQIYNEIKPNFARGDWLAQLQLQKEYLDAICLMGATRSILEGKGDASYKIYLPKVITDQYESRNEESGTNSVLKSAFSNALKQLRYNKPLEMRRDFIKAIHEWDLFGSRVYQVFFESDNRLSGDSFIAVRPHDIWFLDQNKKAITTLKYSEIQKIILENSGREVIIKAGTVAQQRIVRFQSKQGFAIQTS